MSRQGMCRECDRIQSFIASREPSMCGMTWSRFVHRWKRVFTRSRQITSVATTAFWGIYRWHVIADLGQNIEAVFSCVLVLHIRYQTKKKRRLFVSRSCMMFQRKVNIVFAPQCKPRRLQQYTPLKMQPLQNSINFGIFPDAVVLRLSSSAHLQHPWDPQRAPMFLFSRGFEDFGPFFRGLFCEFFGGFSTRTGAFFNVSGLVLANIGQLGKNVWLCEFFQAAGECRILATREICLSEIWK